MIEYSNRLPCLTSDEIDFTFDFLDKHKTTRKDTIFIKSINIINIYARHKYDTYENYETKIKLDIGVDVDRFNKCIKNGLIFFPINGPVDFTRGIHWSLLVYCSFTNAFYHFDTLSNQINSSSARSISDIISTYFDFNNPCIRYVQNHFVQSGDWECGYFLLRLADIIYRMTGPIDLIRIRTKWDTISAHSIKKCNEIREFLDTQMVSKDYKSYLSYEIINNKKKRKSGEMEKDFIDINLSTCTKKVKNQIRVMAQFEKFEEIFKKLYHGNISTQTSNIIKESKEKYTNIEEYWPKLMKDIQSTKNGLVSAENLIKNNKELKILIDEMEGDHSKYSDWNISQLTKLYTTIYQKNYEELLKYTDVNISIKRFRGIVSFLKQYPKSSPTVVSNLIEECTFN